MSGFEGFGEIGAAAVSLPFDGDDESRTRPGSTASKPGRTVSQYRSTYMAVYAAVSLAVAYQLSAMATSFSLLPEKRNTDGCDCTRRALSAISAATESRNPASTGYIAHANIASCQMSSPYSSARS
eukprot:Amastigsp_a182550_3.p4 type:complete len:126 gc:universal Amastigsp_a182550_3:231-608(+)